MLHDSFMNMKYTFRFFANGKLCNKINMETFYLGIVIFLFMLAVFDLVVGVSNDAVNFLNSAIGSKAAPFRTIMIIAAIGVFVGATTSNGMMDIARHGIYQPEHFYFVEVMTILMAVMLTDVFLLDVFNSMGMPTSTTVSLIFELLGGTFAIALVKTINDPALNMGQLINTDKALSVIMAIFLSVVVAFFFGALVQYLARLVFTFNYKARMNYFIGLFGGLSTTAIIYFMLIKGLKTSTLMTSEVKDWVNANTMLLILGCFVFFTLFMQLLHICKVNVFKVVVLLGTFSLALAFAGNDLVNFIGVPLAGYSSYMDFSSVQGASPDTFLMTSLMKSASTPWYFLTGAGLIMVVTLFLSRKAQKVVKTSVNLSRQDEGEETFGSTPIARVLVRGSLQLATAVDKITPPSAKRWINKRFSNDHAIIADGAAFDLVRASVNLVLAGLLIALGTSMKLPLSTTYVTFMVAMGSSLADRAWGRDSAVYRITGVLSVIGGWFITAGAAFTICFFVALLIYYGGMTVVLILVSLVVFMLVRGAFHARKIKEEARDDKMKRILNIKDNKEMFSLLREQTREELGKLLETSQEIYGLTVRSFLEENRRGLKKVTGEIKFRKQEMKQLKRNGTIAICRLDNETVLGRGLYYFQGMDFASELIYSLGRMAEPCMEHIDNNFNPLNEEQKKEFSVVATGISGFLTLCAERMRENDYEDFDDEVVYQANRLGMQLSHLKREELQRIRSCGGSIKVSMVYLTMIQESMNVVNYVTNMQKVSRKFQQA